MADIGSWFEAYGVLAVFLGVFAKQIGAPIPALPLLVLAGVQGRDDGVLLLESLLAAAIACLLADGAWYLAGRRYGRSVLGLLCRVSLSPDTCIRKSEIRFERAGRTAVLFAKFIPGVSTLIRPLAGALGMGAVLFLLLDLAGSLLWAGAGLAAGLFFHRQLEAMLRSLTDLGSTAAVVAVAVLALYVLSRMATRLWVRRQLRGMARITAGELADLLARGDKVLVVDVRATGSTPATRVPGAVHALLGSDACDALPALAGDGEIVTYCDCPGDASAARAALKLARRGSAVRVLAGGFGAWVAAGYPVEEAAAVPA